VIWPVLPREKLLQARIQRVRVQRETALQEMNPLALTLLAPLLEIPLELSHLLVCLQR